MKKSAAKASRGRKQRIKTSKRSPRGRTSEARVERSKASLSKSEQERFEEMKRLVDALRIGQAIAYEGPWPERTVAYLEKVSQALEIPLEIWIEDQEDTEARKEVVFCIRDDIEVDDSFRPAVNLGWFRTMHDTEARARRGLSSKERTRSEELNKWLENLGRTSSESPPRGSYTCQPDENPERIQELIRRLEPTVEGQRLRTWIEGREVWVEDLSLEDKTDDHPSTTAMKREIKERRKTGRKRNVKPGTTLHDLAPLKSADDFPWAPEESGPKK